MSTVTEDAERLLRLFRAGTIVPEKSWASALARLLEELAEPTLGVAGAYATQLEERARRLAYENRALRVDLAKATVRRKRAQ